MKEIKGLECKFVTHVRATNGKNPDTHIVKEVIHYTDGTKKNNLRTITDFKRPFWITKEAYRNHKEKKEWEEEYKLTKYECTQSDLVKTAGRLLGKFGTRLRGLKELANSPYLYGCDISSVAIIKQMYQKKYPDCISPYSVSAFDTETNMLGGDQSIIIASIAFKNMVYTAVIKDFIRGIPNPQKKIKECVERCIPDEEVKKNLKYKVVIVDSEIDIVKTIFKQAHMWSPDFVAIWSISFDIPKVLKACERANVSPEEIFCDPTIPKNLQKWWWREGRKFKVSNAGKHTPINIEEQWHTAENTADFFLIDAMSSYRFNRLGETSIPGGYSLDNILNKEVNISKLKFKEADDKKGADWHVFMQKNYPIEYIVYNQWDCLSMLVLDNKTNDLSSTLPAFSGYSSFNSYDSDPRKIVDVFHYYLLDRGYVIGTSPKDIDKNYEKLLSLSGWIITLPSHNVFDNGLRIIKNKPKLSTNIRCFVFDSDCVGSYPSDTLAENVSKSTTRREIITIVDVPEEIFRLENINLLSGKCNSIEYCTNMFNFPSVEKMIELYEKL